MKKPRPINSLKIDASIKKGPSGFHVSLNTSIELTPKECERLGKWLLDAAQFIKEQEKC